MFQNTCVATNMLISVSVLITTRNIMVITQWRDPPLYVFDEDLILKYGENLKNVDFERYRPVKSWPELKALRTWV